MKRYLPKQRRLTAEERLAAHRAACDEAIDEIQAAIARLAEIIAAGPPTTTTDYVEVQPGEPGYDDAPLEASIVMDSRVFVQKVAQQLSPWSELAKGGVFPPGLGETVRGPHSPP